MTETPLKLSILDLVPVRGEQTTSDALRASKSFVEKADALGYTRYWVAEHHNMPAIASSHPALELMHLGQNTKQIRLGSGGVMLPNHAPYSVAEQFSLLAAVYGDRIDLGIGRAPGTDPFTRMAMWGHLGDGQVVNREGQPVDPVEYFPQHVMDILRLLGPDGLDVELFGDRKHTLRATPKLDVNPAAQVWLLGSSNYSSQLAAALGLPYVFANHFAGRGAQQAMQTYRDQFEASQFGSQPRSFMTANVVVAETEEEAWNLAQPFLYQMANLRVGAPMRSMPTVGRETDEVMSAGHRAVADKLAQTYIIGTPKDAARQLRELAAEGGVDEVMMQAVAGGYPDEDLSTSVARERTLELLAEELF